MDGRPANGREGGRKDGRTNERKDGRTSGQTNGWTEGRTDGLAGGRAGGLSGGYVVNTGVRTCPSAASSLARRVFNWQREAISTRVALLCAAPGPSSCRPSIVHGQPVSRASLPSERPSREDERASVRPSVHPSGRRSTAPADDHKSSSANCQQYRTDT